ncbi:MAG: threonine ammonia-lyase [Anaerolineae bacterium]
MIGLADVLKARQRLGNLVRRTPLQYSYPLSQLLGGEIYLKLECWQKTGSFKVRGALNKMASLSEEEKARGAVAVSSGNFALGVAYAAHAMGGMPLDLFMPVGTPRAKVNKLQEFPARIFLEGNSFDEAYDISREFERKYNKTFIHPMNDLLVIAGQGTLGLEIMEDLPDVETILVPIGGGGLISGVAVAAKALNPDVKIIGVQVEASPSAYLSLKEGRCYERYDYAPTIAEGLAGGFGLLPFQIVRDLLEEIVLVSEEEMYRAIYTLLETSQIVVEGSGAVGVAAMLSGKVNAQGRKVAVVLSGGNIDASLLVKIAEAVSQR